MNEQNSISVIIPALNEQARLEGSVREVLEAARQCFDRYEVIIINDGSTDRTGEVAERLRAENACISVIHNQRPRNLGGAYKQGLARARMHYVTLVNGKHDTTAAELTVVWSQKGRADIIVPYSADVSYRHPCRRLVSRTFTVLVNTLFGLNLRYCNHFVLHRRELVQSIELRTSSYAFQAEALVKLIRRGHSYIEVAHRDKVDNEGGTRSYRMRNVLATVVFFLRLLFDVYATGKYRRSVPSSGRSFQPSSSADCCHPALEEHR